MKIKILNKSTNPMPEYKTRGASGMDIQANLDESIILKPLERALVPTGLYMELPLGYEAQVRARSGLALKKGLTLANGIGTIDSDYRGELKVIVINLSNEEIEINHGERIAQVVIMKYEEVEIEEAEELSETERKDGGFGHTGI